METIEKKPEPRPAIQTQTVTGFLSPSQTLIDKGQSVFFPPWLTVRPMRAEDEEVEMTITIKRKDRRER